ncbi:MAG: iron-sulfur cluster biosynthesis family protein [Cyclobacteriaceae bacterium]
MDISIEPVTLTQEAAKEVRHIMENKNIPDGYGLRIGVRGGKGCAGVNFYVGFDKPGENDLRYEAHGIPLLINKGETMYLVGVTLDFYEGSDARGFTFSSPGDS